MRYQVWPFDQIGFFEMSTPPFTMTLRGPTSLLIVASNCWIQMAR